MKSLITGSSGLVGSALVEYLFSRGQTIQCLKRSPAVGSGRFWATEALSKIAGGPYQNIIHLADEKISPGRWTAKKKQQILMSRLEGTRQLIDFILLQKDKPNIFLCASAIGYYGSRADEILDEKSSPGSGFLADACCQVEEETRRLSAVGIRVVNLRFGMILSPMGGALEKMVPPFQARLGGIVGNGEQFISWISIRDAVQAINFIINNPDLDGPVNVVNPIQTTNRALTQALGKALNRPTVLRIPSFIVRLLYGQMADELLLCSAWVTPRVLLESGYQFTDQSLDSVLHYCLAGK